MKKVLNLLFLTLVICCIAFAFTACNENEREGITTCNENEHEEITNAYAKLHNVDKSEINFTCYAQFDGAHVLILNWAYPDALSEETIDGVVFHHSQIKTFDIYSSGEFYSLQEAFDSGLLSHDNLLTLSDIYNPQYID